MNIGIRRVVTAIKERIFTNCERVVASKCLRVLVIAGFSSFGTNQAQALPSVIGEGYCALRHPIEAVTSNRSACESQHVVQRQSSGVDEENTIWINTTLHDYLDRSKDRPWEKQRPVMSTFASFELERAYMIGTYANGYHFFIYDHRNDGYMTLFAWDGVSHAVYAISAIVNLPAKELSYLAYMIKHKLMRDKDTQLTDALIGVAIDIAETSVGVLYSSVGVVTGTVFHPLLTVKNIIPAVPLVLSTFVAATYGALINPIKVLFW
ncbi:hypothetical protein [Paraburkholderia sp. J94]|uniref:hypothetical protein n=1 Tax=Paraburkholderia sp. J94 TaxID=2805441 RepID=UPI002AB093B6|nr:hypothetical protein [Paraburkholderia sp. J94]